MKLSSIIYLKLAIASIICISCSKDKPASSAKNETNKDTAKAAPPGAIIDE